MTRFEKGSVLASSLLTLVTGVVYAWMKYLLTPSEPWAVVNHPLQPWVLKAHILVAPLLVFSVGAIAVRHVWQHYRAGVRWARRSGLTTALAVAPMIVTGYLIQAVTNEGWLRAMAWSHLGVGILYGAGLAAHWAATRGARRAPLLRQTRRLRVPAERVHVAHRPRGPH